MAKPLQLGDFDRHGVDIAYLWNACRGTFRDCPLKGIDVDIMMLTLQISGLEYVDPLVADSPQSLGQMLHNGTADLGLETGEIMYAYELFAYTGAVDKKCYYFEMPLQEPIVVGARRVAMNLWSVKTHRELFQHCGMQCVVQNRREASNNNESYSFTEFLLDTFPWIYYVYLTLGIAAISTILTISQRESVRSMLVEWPLRLLAVVLRQPTLDRFSRNARLSGLVAAAASLLPFTIFAMYFELNIKLLLAVPFQHRLPAHSIDELIHAMKHGGYKFVMRQSGYSPLPFATPKQKAELEALTDRFVVYPYDDNDDFYRSITDPALKRVSLASDSWSVGHGADILIDSDDRSILYVKIKDITPRYAAYLMRRELYKERERLNRALALVQPAAINFPFKYPPDGFEYSLKLDPKYNNTVRFAQYRLVLVFFGAIYLGCILVFFLEIVVHKMAYWLRMWHTLGTARPFH